MNNKFEFVISRKLSFLNDGLVVIHGEWLGGRVARGDVLTLLQGKKRLPLYISAVDIAEGPGKLVLACGVAQESVRVAKSGDRLVSSDAVSFKASSLPVVLRTVKEEKAHSTAAELHHLKARQILADSLWEIALLTDMAGSRPCR